MLRLYKQLTKKEIIFLFISIVFIIAQVWLDLKMPDYMSQITVLVQTQGSSMNDILVNGAFMLLCAFGSLISAFIVGYFASYIGTSFEKHLRRKIFTKALDLSMEDIKNFSTSSLITRSTNDINQVKMFLVMGIGMLIKAPFKAVIAISKIANKGFEFSLITAIGVLLIVLLITILIILVLPKFKIVQTLNDNLNRITRENLTGIRVVRAYNAEKFQENKFDIINSKLTKTHLFIGKSMALLSPIMGSVMSGISLAIYWVGASLINAAGLTDKIVIFGDMVVFSSYAIQVITAFMMLIFLFVLYPRAKVSADRINEVLDTENKIIFGNKKQGLKGLQGTIEFKNVSFKYPDAEENLLDNISFKVNKGETIAFIGSTGSGKTTLINLIPRFYDATSGEILLDGINIKEYEKQALYDKMGYISQKAIIFKGTIKDNISFGNNQTGKPTKRDVIDATEIAQAKEFISNMNEGINSEVAQSGNNVSGGQKQRLSIARAIARKPEIYIFDDSFSALDYKTDYALRKALNKYTKDATKLIVAQRIGTIKDADQIVVLDNGKCVGIGTHKELLKKCKVYKEIALSQLSKEELKNA